MENWPIYLKNLTLDLNDFEMIVTVWHFTRVGVDPMGSTLQWVLLMSPDALLFGEY